MDIARQVAHNKEAHGARRQVNVNLQAMALVKLNSLPCAFWWPVVVIKNRGIKMDITKNDEAHIAAIGAELEQIKHAYFTHLLNVNHNPLTSNLDCKRINDLIKNHFDMLSDDNKSNDTYKLSRGGVDSNGESGWEQESNIDDLQYLNCEIVNGKIVVRFRMKLSSEVSHEF